ncbi:MAG: class I adenylate-forming enzyme family protein [Hyphomonadaceae bacterium]
MTEEVQFPVRSVAECDAILTAPGAKFEIETVCIRGVDTPVYKHAPPTMRHILETSRTFGDREYFVFQDERASFNAHFRAAANLAKALRERFGVEKGDRVAIAARNFPQWFPSFFGAMAAGAIVTPLNSWWTAEELEYGLTDSGAKVAIIDPERLELLRPLFDKMPDLKHVIVMRGGEGDPDPRVTGLETLIGPVNSWKALDDIDLPAIDIGPEDDATILYTSGTTGKPKGAVATQRATVTNLFHSVACQARSFLRRGEAPPVHDPVGPIQRVTLLAIPLFHATGCYASMLAALMRGDKIVTMYRWNPLEALQVIEREKVTTFGGVPAIAWQVLEHPERDNYDLSSIQFVAYGGAPSAPELVSTIKRRFSEATVSNGWGMTETCATATLNVGADYELRPESAGAGGPASRMKIIDANGQALPPGGVGELWYFGANNCREYWNKPEATAKTFVDGWVVTGDIARLDDEGFLFLLDRAKDMLIRGGENIYCIEVESALYDHPAIMDAAVVGIPHKVLGEEVGAVVQRKPNAEVTEDDLRGFVAERLAAFKVPVQIHFQDEPLPRNANGKIMKPELRDRFKGGDKGD